MPKHSRVKRGQVIFNLVADFPLPAGDPEFLVLQMDRDFLRFHKPCDGIRLAIWGWLRGEERISSINLLHSFIVAFVRSG